jgi:Mg-chelatase subunit ChlD
MKTQWITTVTLLAVAFCNAQNCIYKKPNNKGSPCPNGYIKWNEPQAASFVPGFDITSQSGMTIDSCKDLCWTYPGCVSIDFTTAGVCYLNYQSTPMSKSNDFKFVDFTCCRKTNVSCEARSSAAGNSAPCYSKSAKFVDYVPGRYISGQDIKVLNGQTVDSCQAACWNTPFCQSADFKMDGTCYLNYVSGPATSVSALFSFIGFDCCDPPPAECEKKEISPTGGPCPNGYVKWTTPKYGYGQPGNDIQTKGVSTIEACRDFCMTVPGCVQADLHYSGVCYAGSARKPVTPLEGYINMDFECCSNLSLSVCVQKAQSPTGSPCPSSEIKWKDPTPTRYVPGNDLAFKAGMNITSCQAFCWTYPGCVSADLKSDGTCYLNYANTPIGFDNTFSLLDYECCHSNPAQNCTKRVSKAGNSGPCFSSVAKFLDHQPGKYISGYDIKSAVGHTVDSCRQWCWDTAGCQSADLSNEGVCFLNNVKGPVTANGYFSFIDFDCCAPPEPTCQYKPVAPTGGPCPNGYILWTNPKPNLCQVGNDITSKGGMTMDSCRELCLTYPGCTGVDITTEGVCYINFKREPLTACNGFTNSNLECCSNVTNNECILKNQVPTGSPCVTNEIKWKDAKPTQYVAGNDLATKSGMNITSCQDFCWSYPGCVSADITSDGVCYLNYANTPIAYSNTFSLLEFECCHKNPEPTCSKRISTAGGSGPCYSDVAKFLDHQPGKFVSGYDIKSEKGHTVVTCRELCWNTPRCQSADINNEGVCFLNSVKGPVTTNGYFSFIDFDCCPPSEPACEYKTPITTGGPCPNGYVMWTNPKTNICQWGNDITSKGGMTMESCRELCLSYPGCTGVDITKDAVCWINFKKEPLTTCDGFTNSNLECCSNSTSKVCSNKSIKPTGSPCPSGNIRWSDPKPTLYVPGNDILSKGGMTIASCKALCWSYPGCVSADISFDGICYLNKASSPTAQSNLHSLLEYECCNPNEPPTCRSVPSKAGNMGPCYSGSAKFLDYIPGKYVPGNDIKVIDGQTIETCRNLCWDTPQCQSADITVDGLCFLNNVRGPLSSDPTFSFIDFECCPSKNVFVTKEVVPTGSPCPSGSVRWVDPKKTIYVPGYDISSKSGMTIDSCQDWCWRYPGCVSADLTNTGVCYLNYAAGPTATSDVFSLLEYECCNTNANPVCQNRPSNASSAGPCSSQSAKFLDPQPGKYIVGMDINVFYQQTVASCRQLCWDTPKCQSADITNEGVCFLNSVKAPLATNALFSFIDFECCASNITTQTLTSTLKTTTTEKTVTTQTPTTPKTDTTQATTKPTTQATQTTKTFTTEKTTPPPPTTQATTTPKTETTQATTKPTTQTTQTTKTLVTEKTTPPPPTTQPTTTPKTKTTQATTKPTTQTTQTTKTFVTEKTTPPPPTTQPTTTPKTETTQATTKPTTQTTQTTKTLVTEKTTPPPPTTQPTTTPKTKTTQATTKPTTQTTQTTKTFVTEKTTPPPPTTQPTTTPKTETTQATTKPTTQATQTTKALTTEKATPSPTTTSPPPTTKTTTPPPSTTVKTVVTEVSTQLTTVRCTPETRVELTFVLDASGSIEETNYVQSLKPTVKGVINLMLPGADSEPSKSRVACVSFSSKSKVEWLLNRYSTKTDLYKAVDALPYYAGFTAIGDPLHDVLTTIHPQVRVGMRHIVILITDGVQNWGSYDALEVAQNLKSAGVSLFVIGVGSETNKEFLDKVSSGPGYRADVSTYKDLLSKMETLGMMTCKEANRR